MITSATFKLVDQANPEADVYSFNGCVVLRFKGDNDREHKFFLKSYEAKKLAEVMNDVAHHLNK